MSGQSIPLAGVIGHPIAHSKSPRMHGYWLRQHDKPGFYVPMDVAPDDLDRVLTMLPRAGFVGLNITAPHKGAALALANTVTERAARIGAANTLTFQPDGEIAADCTDGEGFLGNLRQQAPDWAGAAGPVTVLGAGGAACAVIDALLAEGVTELRLTNRTRTRAEALADRFGPAVQVVDWAEATAAMDGAATVVNTTSLGMAGAAPFDLDLSPIGPGVVATDIVYVPLATPFLVKAAGQGAQTVDGLGMLLHQGVGGFASWFGVRPEVTAELRQIMLAP